LTPSLEPSGVVHAAVTALSLLPNVRSVASLNHHWTDEYHRHELPLLLTTTVHV
jgi:hypothetical protein